jgi:hypothetical protein
MRRLLVCVHDATPAYFRETRELIRGLAPLLGRRFSCGVVPDWHGQWSLAAHPDYCNLVRDGAEELLLHGFVHRRRHGWGPVALLTGSSDEMNGLDRDATRRTIERGQRVFIDAFGTPARTFLAPGWQAGRVRPADGALGIEHLLGFFALESRAGRKVPLATWSWDCDRLGVLGRVGHALGSLLHVFGRRVPTLAIHPRDLSRGFWPTILRLTERLLANGFEPTTPTRLLESLGRQERGGGAASNIAANTNIASDRKGTL